MAFYDLAGFAGAAIIVAAYFANQQRWLSSEDWRYPVANLLGSLLILVSLFFEWNFPSFVIEIFWIAISLYGTGKALRSARQKARSHQEFVDRAGALPPLADRPDDE